MSRLIPRAEATATATLLDEPALPPPVGVTPGVMNHSGEQAWFFLVASLCTVIPGTLLLLRLYTRLRIFRKVDSTDYAVVLAFLSFVVMLVVGREVISEGAAVHMWNLQLKHYIKLQYWLYVSMIIYGPIIFLVKLAILLQYLRLFAPTRSVNPVMYVSARMIILVTLCFYIMSSCISAFSCSPREKIWNPLITGGQCLRNTNALILATCVFNIVSDVTILLLPARAVWKLQIPRKKKIAIVALFGIGLLACIANIMIIYYTTRMSGPNADISYNTAWFGYWVYAEISLGIIVTCTSSLPKLVEAKGEKVVKAFSAVIRPLRYFSSLVTNVTPTKRDFSELNAASKDRANDDRMHLETELV